MDLLRARLREIAPAVAAGSRVDHGVLEGRGWSWLALPNHTGRPSHFDIGFTLHSSAVIADCISGTGPLSDAVAQVVDVWAQTSAACFRELVAPGSAPAAHRRGPSDPGGVPGWRSVVSDVMGYGTEAVALREALGSRGVLGEVGLTLAQGRHNGIKVYLHKTSTETTGEVRVNGVLDPAASQALAAMEWPETKVPATARFYAVAIPAE
jgi:hypothetical protein